MSALERPEAPPASAACSQSVTRAPRAARASAMATPATPPPTTTTSAVSGMSPSLGRRPGRVKGPAPPREAEARSSAEREDDGQADAQPARRHPGRERERRRVANGPERRLL